MASPAKRVVLFTMLLLPSRLVAQVQGAVAPEEGAVAVHTVAVSPPQRVELDEAPAGQLASPFICYTCGDSDKRTVPQAIFAFGGFYTTQDMGNTANSLQVDYERSYAAALGYQRYPWSWRGFQLGGEIGVASRFGKGYSVELWVGPTVRCDFMLGDWLRVTPSLTIGFSAVSKTMGIEREREESHQGNASVLFYLGPEVAFSTTAHPNIELFWRLHHRSGANGTLGGVMEGHNANVFGVRCRF